MRLGDVDHQESDAAAVLLVELVEGGNLPPERRSSVAAENEDDGLGLVDLGELDPGPVVELHQGEIRAGSPIFSVPARARVQTVSNGNSRNGTGPGILDMTVANFSGGCHMAQRTRAAKAR